MFSPESIDLKSLPWVNLEDKRELPKKPCIYFVLDSSDSILYVGKSINVFQRWVNHEIVQKIPDLAGIRIVYLYVEDFDLLSPIEEALIEWFNPLLNRRRYFLTLSVKNISEKRPGAKTKVICNLDSILKERGISQLRLSEETGITRRVIRSYQNNRFRMIDVEAVVAICHFFDIEMWELFELQ